MNIKNTHPIYSLGLLISLGLIWGTGYSIARFAMTNGVPPLGYSFWQSVGPAAVLLLITTIRKQTQRLTVANLRFYLVCGLTGIAIPNSIMYFSAPHLPAGILAMVVNTVPIIAYPLALTLKLEYFNWQRMIGILAAIVALMLIILPQASLPSPDMAPWVLLSLITPLSFAVCSIYIARCRPQHHSNLFLSAGMLVSSSLILLPLVASTNSFYLFHLPLNMADWVVISEILLSSAGYLLFFRLIQTAGPVYYSLVDTIVVLTGLFWGRLLFNERLTEWTTVAVYLILFALLLVTRHQFPAKNAETA